MTYDPPVIGPITCDYACHLAGGRTGGIDYAVNVGTPVHAIAGGIVTVSTNNGGTAGIYVEINHGGLYSRYLHLSVRQINVGNPVMVRQVIGLSGNTGNSTGPHLHHDVGTAPGNVQRINPQTLFDAPPVQEEDMANVFKMPGRPEQYHLVGGKLIHIPTEGYLQRLGSPKFVEVVKTDALWNSPVEYPAGVPAAMR